MNELMNLCWLRYFSYINKRVLAARSLRRVLHAAPSGAFKRDALAANAFTVSMCVCLLEIESYFFLPQRALFF